MTEKLRDSLNSRTLQEFISTNDVMYQHENEWFENMGKLKPRALRIQGKELQDLD